METEEERVVREKERLVEVEKGRKGSELKRRGSAGQGRRRQRR